MIAPHELKNKVFNKSVRGYNCAEVDEYIDFLIDKYTEAYKQNLDLENQLRTTKAKYSELHHDEDTIRAVIVKAQKLGENIVKKAKSEADKIIASVDEICRERVAEAEQKIIDSKKEAEEIKALSEDFKNSLYAQYVEHIKTLKALEVKPIETSEGDFQEEVKEIVEEKIKQAKDGLLSEPDIIE